MSAGLTAELTARLREVVAGIRALVRAIDPSALDTATAAAAVEQFAELERLAGSGKLLLAPRAAEGSAWRSAGHRTPESWLAQQSGTSVGAAKAALDAASRLDELPATATAVRQGELSAAQLEEVTAAAIAGGSASEDAMLQAARAKMPLRHLRDERRRAEASARTRESAEERHRRVHAARFFRKVLDDDGSVRLEGKVTPEVGAEVWAALQPFIRRAFDAARRVGIEEPAEAYAADGLRFMARATVGLFDHDGRAPEVKLILHADAAALERGWVEPGERCEFEDLGPVPADVARSYATDAFWAVVLSDGEDIRSVCHLGRRVTARQRTALEARDRCCVVPGCGQTFGLEIHHVDEWHLTFRTELDQLARVCWHHHGMVSRGEARLERLAQGRWRFAVHGGAVLDDPPRPPPTEPAAEPEPLLLSLAG